MRWSLILGWLMTAAGCATPGAVAIDERAHGFEIRIDGEPLTTYLHRHAPKPILFPLFAPGRRPVTRSWPMAEVPGEERDHPHHESLWFAHGDVNGFDFWSNRDDRAHIVHDAVLGRGRAWLATRNLWLGDGAVVCTEERRLRFARTEWGPAIDFEFTLIASHAAVTFGDTKEGTLALRLHPALRLRGELAGGHCLNSEGLRDGDCWGKRARWVSYWGPIEGATVSVTIFDHPSNPRHPTWWHARDYGLFAANPFGVHDFEHQPAGSGDLRLEPGERISLRYRLLLGLGAADVQQLESAFANFAAPD